MSAVHQTVAKSATINQEGTMALPDPIPTLTVDSVTYDFARVGFSDVAGTFRTADNLDKLVINHRYGPKRNRFSARVDRVRQVDDPFVTYQNIEVSHSCYIVWDSPVSGVTPAENQELGQLLYAFLASGTPDNDLRILQGEL